MVTQTQIKPALSAQRGRAAKRKGAAAERFIRDFLLDALGVVAHYTRSTQAAGHGGPDLIVYPADNGGDCLGLDQYAIQVRDRATVRVASSWLDTIRRTTSQNHKPLLFYKHNRKWVVRLPLPQALRWEEHYMDVSLEGFVYIFSTAGETENEQRL